MTFIKAIAFVKEAIIFIEKAVIFIGKRGSVIRGLFKTARISIRVVDAVKGGISYLIPIIKVKSNTA